MGLATRCLVTMVTILFSSGQALAGDWLDVQARNVRILDGGATVKEGQSVKFDCSWSLGFADDHSYWHTKTTQRFPIQLDVDGQVLLTDEGVVAAGTKLEMPDGGFSGALTGTSKPATWVAKGVGQHRLFCSVNKPKGISDQYPGNNEKWVAITVVPEFAVQPGQPWPSPADGDEGSKKDPSARRTMPPKNTLPGSGRTKMLNPQPEVPSKGNVRALNPQPEVPSKPKAGDDQQKKKKSNSGRTRPPPTP